MNIKGSCLCQSVKYELQNATLHEIANCHCPNCRKTHGAAFGTYIPVREGEFRWIQGEELVTRFESSANTYRCFCSLCGSPMAAYDGKNIRCLTLGSTDGDTGLRPQYHMHVRDKVAWYEITDDLHQYDLRAPDTKPQVDPLDK